jgi:hypothetical protein
VDAHLSGRITGQVPARVPIMLQAQSSREINLRQACREIGEKGSEIVPLGALLMPAGFPNLVE